MCVGGGGGGGGGGKIKVPDYKAYNKLAKRQMEAMASIQESGTGLLQLQLNEAVNAEGEALAKLRDLKVVAANETAANAARLAALLGPPPPEKAASAPVIGADRTRATAAKGRKQLRIDRADPTMTAAGAGLNITTGG